MSTIRAKEGTPPPIIGKAGNYTVFITPPVTPKPFCSPKTPDFSVDLTQSSKISSSPKTPPKPTILAPEKVEFAPSSDLSAPKCPPSPPPPVQVPPQQFEKVKEKQMCYRDRGSTFGFFWNAVAKVQDAHSNFDEYLANWFGLNQSKYQWALNDYHESKGMLDFGDKKGANSVDEASRGSGERVVLILEIDATK